MPIQSIDSRRLYRQICDQLCRLIESGEYKPGDRLPAERALAEKLGVSRPTVREALIAMEVAGIIEIRGGAGVFVLARGGHPGAASTQVDSPGPFEVLQARDIVEPEVAALAARNATDEHIKAMSTLLAEMVCCSATDPQCVEYDRRFHFELARACGNATLATLLQILWQARTDAFYRTLEDHFHSELTWQGAIIEHRAILEAIKSHNARAARDAMRKHIRHAEKRFASNWHEAD